MATRPPLRVLGLNTGKKARLHRILFQHGLRNGTAIFLPYDQGLEHGPRDFFANPKSSRPGVHRPAGTRGRVQRHRDPDRAGREVLLGLRRRGAADPQAQRQDRHPVRRRGALTGQRHRRRCRRLGADAVGYTLYVGTPAQEQDFEQYRRVRADAQRLGHAADRVGLSARLGDRGQGRQGLLLRRRLRRPHRERARRRRRQGQLPAPREARPRSRPSTTRSSPPSRRSTPSCGRPTGRWCWSPAEREPATRRCSRRPASRWRPAPPA